MTALLFWSILLGMGLFAYDTLRSKSRVPQRWMTALFFVLWIPTLGLIYGETLGHHRPAWMAWDLQPGQYRVRDAKLVEGEAIYVYLDTKSQAEPLAVELPWRRDLAEQLQDAMRESMRRKQRGALMDFSHSWHRHDRPPKFHPLPQQRTLPPKPPQEAPPRIERDT